MQTSADGNRHPTKQHKANWYSTRIHHGTVFTSLALILKLLTWYLTSHNTCRLDYLHNVHSYSAFSGCYLQFYLVYICECVFLSLASSVITDKHQVFFVDIMSSAGWAYSTASQELSVCTLTSVSQITTATHRLVILHRIQTPATKSSHRHFPHEKFPRKIFPKQSCGHFPIRKFLPDIYPMKN